MLVAAERTCAGGRHVSAKSCLGEGEIQGRSKAGGLPSSELVLPGTRHGKPVPLGETASGAVGSVGLG